VQKSFSDCLFPYFMVASKIGKHVAEVQLSMAFDYKKEYKEFYMPKNKPEIIDIPTMNFIAVRGKGNPNEPDGEYKAAMSLLYGIAFTIKMSRKRAAENFPSPFFSLFSYPAILLFQTIRSQMALLNATGSEIGTPSIKSA
jgi:hypothetical protein